MPLFTGIGLGCSILGGFGRERFHDPFQADGPHESEIDSEGRGIGEPILDCVINAARWCDSRYFIGMFKIRNWGLDEFELLLEGQS